MKNKTVMFMLSVLIALGIGSTYYDIKLLPVFWTAAYALFVASTDNLKSWSGQGSILAAVIFTAAVDFILAGKLATIKNAIEITLIIVLPIACGIIFWLTCSEVMHSASVERMFSKN